MEELVAELADVVGNESQAPAEVSEPSGLAPPAIVPFRHGVTERLFGLALDPDDEIPVARAKQREEIGLTGTAGRGEDGLLFKETLDELALAEDVAQHVVDA